MFFRFVPWLLNSQFSNERQNTLTYTSLLNWKLRHFCLNLKLYLKHFYILTYRKYTNTLLDIRSRFISRSYHVKIRKISWSKTILEPKLPLLNFHFSTIAWSGKWFWHWTSSFDTRGRSQAIYSNESWPNQSTFARGVWYHEFQIVRIKFRIFPHTDKGNFSINYSVSPFTCDLVTSRMGQAVFDRSSTQLTW